MKSLAEKLQSLGVQIGPQGLTQKPRQKKPAPLDAVLPGSWEATPHGDVFVVHKTYPLGTPHGDLQITPAVDLSWLERDPALSGITSIPYEQIAFIDTETTGLSGGTGTYTFIVGAGKFEENRFHVAQFFLHDPGAETAQLWALEKFLCAAQAVVSYNGKSFDLPRLITRYKIHGWPPPLLDAHHIDLLHIVRRIWSSVLPTCSLGDIEYHLFHLERDSTDIPGWQIPEKFFEFLHSKDPLPLQRIFYHNEMDVISLAALLRYISARISTPLAPGYSKLSDLAAIGSYFYSVHRYQQALIIHEHILQHLQLPVKEKISVQKELAMTYKRLDLLDQALPLWEAVARHGDLDAHIELAKAYEHSFRQYQEALHWTLSAIEQLENTSLEPAKHPAEKDLFHRLDRLKKKFQHHQPKES